MTKSIKIIAVFLIVALTVKLALSARQARARYEETRKNSICPSLFSISRSARDTLIVMKAEPLCNVYMLDSLK